MNNRLRGLLESRNRFDSYIRRGDSVADLGCGSGYYTMHFAHLVGEEGIVYAADTNTRAVRALQRSVSRKGIRNIRLSTSSAASLGFIPASSVDFVLSSLTLCCMVEHDEAVDEMLRIMKPGARAYVSITTFGRRNDPRKMSADEFDRVKGRFTILESMEGRTVSAALLEKR